MQVLFRKDRSTKEVIAFLPEATANYGYILSYAHMGQHSEAIFEYYQDTQQATEEEYKPLLAELKAIYSGEKLEVKKRLNMDVLRMAWV